MFEIIILLFWQLLAYSLALWGAFIAIAFLVARYGGFWAIPVGHLLIAAIICFLDIRWIQIELEKTNWNGSPDMDFIFYLGVAMRILIVNSVLLPVSIIGYNGNRSVIKH